MRGREFFSSSFAKFTFGTKNLCAVCRILLSLPARGAWIEIMPCRRNRTRSWGRSPHRERPARSSGRTIRSDHPDDSFPVSFSAPAASRNIPSLLQRVRRTLSFYLSKIAVHYSNSAFASNNQIQLTAVACNALRLFCVRSRHMCLKAAFKHIISMVQQVPFGSSAY